VDNLTHSLAGLIIGDAAIALRARFGSPASTRYRAAALTTAVFANNAPDLDFVYVGITGGRLGYLLHHRGHTHTVAAVLPLAMLALVLVSVGFRRWGSRQSAAPLSSADRLHLALLGVIGGLTHMLMDYGNNYGVHPFWPVYDGWLYGDAIFIIEPWLLLILIGMAGGISRSRVLRAALLLSLLALLGLAWTVELAGVWLASALTALSLPWVWWLWRASVEKRWAFGGGALVALWTILLGTRHVARASVRDGLETSASELRLLDLVSTPAPGNPLCWSLLAVQRSETQYVVRQALASGWPGRSSAESCRAMSESQTAPVVPSSLPSDDATRRRVVWGPEFRAPVAELEQLLQSYCGAKAFSRFARVPFWIPRGTQSALIGDLRFDRSSALEFAELLLAPDVPCPSYVPPWSPPVSL
jgi:inner membrane protein